MAVKQMQPWRLPPVLILCLKRFLYTERGTTQKNNRRLKLPVDGVDMRPFMAENSEDEGAWYL